MHKNWKMLAVPLATASLAVGLIGKATAAPLAPEGMEAEMVQLEKTAPDSTPDIEAADFSAATLKLNQSNAIQSAPGFSERSSAIESLLREPVPPVNPLALPIPPENFTYHNGGVANAHSKINQTYFRACFRANHGVLGAVNDVPLSRVFTATGDSGISPYLDEAVIERLQSVRVKFRYAFSGSYNSSLKLYLTNLTTGKVQLLGNLKSTTANRKNPCVTVNHDVTHYINEPGVYGLRLVLNNRNIRFPIDPPYAREAELGAAPGDVIDLGGATAEDASDVVVDDRLIKPRPLPPIYYFPKTVAGFNQVVVTVTRKH
jgi:hypothetical protein